MTVTKLLLTLTLIFSISSTTAIADNLFDSINPDDGSISPRPTVHAFYNVDLNFDALIEAPEVLDISLPDSTSITVTKRDFQYRRGFEFRTEDDPPGPPVYIIPGFPIADMSYKWSGGNDQWDVLLTVTRGVLYGIITSNTKRYGISKVNGIDYALGDYNLQAFRPLDGGAGTPLPIPSNRNNKLENPPVDNTSISQLKSYDYSKASLTDELTRGNITNLDILIVWTEDARIEAGGNPGDLTDTADIDALMTTGIDHANDALTNS